ncbi:hypothetical protein RLIN73S_05687 [Rhodanobacter lindaniclasticus]
MSARSAGHALQQRHQRGWQRHHRQRGRRLRRRLGISSASGIAYSGFGAVTGTGGSVTGVTGSFRILEHEDIGRLGHQLRRLQRHHAEWQRCRRHDRGHQPDLHTGQHDRQPGQQRWRELDGVRQHRRHRWRGALRHRRQPRQRDGGDAELRQLRQCRDWNWRMAAARPRASAGRGRTSRRSRAMAAVRWRVQHVCPERCQRGSAGGIAFTGFTTADATTVTGAQGLDHTRPRAAWA